MGRIDLAAVRRFHVYTDVVLVSVAWIGAYAVRAALSGPLDRTLNPLDSNKSLGHGFCRRQCDSVYRKT